MIIIKMACYWPLATQVPLPNANSIYKLNILKVSKLNEGLIDYHSTRGTWMLCCEVWRLLYQQKLKSAYSGIASLCELN